MKVKSKAIIKAIKDASKALGKTGLKDTEVSLSTNTNGMLMVVDFEDGYITSEVDADIDEDGGIIVSMEDLVDISESYDELDIKYTEGELVYVNGMPLVKLGSQLLFNVNVVGQDATLNETDFKNMVKMMKDVRSNLKKSIMLESSYLKLSTKNDSLEVRTVSPLDYSVKNSSVTSINVVDSETYLDKLRVKTLLGLFAKSKTLRIAFNFGKTEFSNDSYSLILNQVPSINDKLFYPEMRPQ